MSAWSRIHPACPWLVAYLASGALVIVLQPHSGPALWYPPIALGMAFLYRSGSGWWPAIFAADFTLSYFQYQNGVVTAAVVAGNTVIEVLLGAGALRRILGAERVLDYRRYIAIVAIAGIGATGVGATLGTLFMHGFSAPLAPAALESWARWWLGDATTVLCLLPPFLLWWQPVADPVRALAFADGPRVRQRTEFAALLATTVLIVPLARLPLVAASPSLLDVAHVSGIVPLLWAAVRFPAWVSSVVIALLEILAVLSVWLPPLLWPQSHALAADELAQIQIFMIAVGTVGGALALAMESERVARRGLVTAYREEERLNQRLLAMPAMFYVAAAEAPYVTSFVSPYAETMLGFSTARFIGDPMFWLSRIHGDDLERLSRWMEDHQHGPRPRFEFRFRHRDGHYLTMLDDSALLHDAQGQPSERIGVWTDVSELRNAERVLRESERRYAESFDESASGLSLTTLDGHFTRVNPAFCRMLGYSEAELLARSIQDVTHPDDRDRSNAEMARIASGEAQNSTIEKRCLTKSGAVVWAQVTQSAVHDQNRQPLYRVAQVLDITARKDAEVARLQAAARAEAGERANALLLERLNETQTLAYIGSWAWDPANDEVWWSDEIYRICGVPVGSCEVTVARTLSFIHPSDRVSYQQAVETVLQNGKPMQIDLRVVAADGKLKYCQVRAQTTLDHTGRVLRLSGSLQDVSAQWIAAEEIEVGRRLLAEAEDLIHLGAARWDLDTDEWTFSGGWARLQGTASTPLTTVQLMGIIHPDDLARVRVALDAVRNGADYDIEHRIVRPDDGALRWVAARGALRVGELDRRMLIVAGIDITERRQLEARMQESARLEAVGLLAGGIAHDFNNLLSVILGNVHLARRAPHNSTALPGWLAAIDDASQRGKAVVEQILAFSRQQPQQLGPLEFGPLIDEVWGMLRGAIPAGVAIERRIDERLPPILADATQMHQVLMNLCTNAWRAIEQHGRSDGRIELHAVHAALDGAQIADLPGALAPGEYVKLSVSDNGAGMDDMTREHIFEPFFTTRGIGEGTGLGLSVVYGIVARHGGAIVVDSAPGAGARFHLYFPAVHAPVVASTPAWTATLTQLPLGGARVLYVDDEPQLVALGSELLNEEGCVVSGHVDARAALAALAANPAAFDVLVSDYNMPALSGLELAREVRTFAPQLPIILLSGRVTEELTAAAAALDVACVLHKPDLVVELAPAIARSLALG